MKFSEMTAKQLRSVDREASIAVVPIAAVEQHGPHMPTGTDWILCNSLLEAVEARRSDRLLLTPTLWLGASSHHLRFGATLDSSLETYIATLCDLGCSLLDDGFRRILFINGHGGNVDPMRVALRQLQPSYRDALLAGGSYWSVAGDLIRDTLEGDHKTVGHACEFETSMMLYLQPDLVSQPDVAHAGPLVADDIDGVFVSRDMRGRTRDGCTGRPDLASAEKGERLFNGIVNLVVDVVDKLLGEPLGEDYQDYFA